MKITQKGQVTIPKDIREGFALYPGREVRFLRVGKQCVIEKVGSADPWQRYRGFLKKAEKTDDVIRQLRGTRP